MKQQYLIILLFCTFYGCLGKLHNNTIFTLTSDNHFLLKGTVSANSIDTLLLQLNNIDYDKIDKIFLYIASPGGSVIAGNRLITMIESLQNSGIEVNCIADFAASMGFAILQSCTNRYVTSGSILHQHQASGKIQGTLKNMENHLNFIKALVKKHIINASKRMGISREKFERIFSEDNYIYGKDALELKAADRLIHVRCSIELTSQIYTENVSTLYGLYKITYSKCPIIHSPLYVKKIE